MTCHVSISCNSRLKLNYIMDIRERLILVNWLKIRIGLLQDRMTIQLVFGISKQANKYNCISSIMIWHLYHQFESITMQLGRDNSIVWKISILYLWMSSLYSCSWDKTVRCFDTETGQEIVISFARKKNQFFSFVLIVERCSWTYCN